jgi:hypothetical protein
MCSEERVSCFENRVPGQTEDESQPAEQVPAPREDESQVAQVKAGARGRVGAWRERGS